MNEELYLNEIEHNLLSMQVDDEEPLYILYADTTRDVKGANLDLILLALIKLVDLGLSECRIKQRGKWRICKKITISALNKRFKGQSEEQKRKYPDINEYYFRITDKGRVEEAKDIYDSYYPHTK